MAANQSETIAFLSHGGAYGEPGAAVCRLETHISVIFLVGVRAFKLKRAVAFSYLDFSTVGQRRRNCESEFLLGRKMAPGLYRAVHAVTRGKDGGLVLDGGGEPVDWLVEMRRFDQEALFDRLAGNGRLSPALMRELADGIAAFHASAEPIARPDGAQSVRAVIVDILGNLERAGIFKPAEIAALASRLCAEFDAGRALIERRQAAGKVRRCHGDLHLRNICLLDGKPTLFDPIEFNDAIATIDVLYDLAFLLMDLIHEGHGEFANLVFNRYLDRSDESDGLALLPIYLAMRAAIRAHVSAAANMADRAQSYFRLATELVRPQIPGLVAIGGLSGSGKSTLAQNLAPALGRAPGARILRSDVIRKRLHGVPPETRLPPAAYGVEINARVYGALYDAARTALAAGQAVIADAVFLRSEERVAIEAAARDASVPFTGIWLEARTDLLERRLAGRTSDASDADAAVLQIQLGLDPGPIGWHRLAAEGDVAAAAREAIARR